MEKEKDTKKKTTTKKTTTKKSTTKKTSTKKTTTTKKVTAKKEVKKEVEVVMPYEEKVMPYTEKVMPYEDKEVIKEIPVVEEKVETPVKEEKKKPSVFILVLIGLFAIGMIFVVIQAFLNNTNKHENSFISLGGGEETVLYKDYKVLDSKEELESLFPTRYISGVDFNRFQYVVLELSYNPCGEDNVKPVDYEIKNNTVYVTVQYEASCGGCKPEKLFYLLELNKNAKFDDVEFEYEALNDPHCSPFVAYKPILYLYPKEKTDVTVTLGNEELLTTTYPKYEDGWKVTAYPDGTLKDSKREYYGLFWEGDNHPAKVHKDGFVVSGEDTLEFLEKELKVLGLTDKEANEFIIYWLPKLENNTYNYIYFETMEEINNYMPISINPTPDTVIRIQMDYKPLDEKINVKEQTFKTPVRKGFTVVEWGGSIIKD